MAQENSQLHALFIQRLPFLRLEEKQALLSSLENGLDYAGLFLGDIAAIIGRHIAYRDFDACRIAGQAEDDAEFLVRTGSRFVCICDPAYPAALREIPDPPFGLYLRGADIPSDRPALAIVGTRYPTPEGITAAESAAEECACADIGVISGLARGLDSAAHRGALAGGGFTCAVMPCGIESVYPQSNRNLAASILEKGGLLLSEYPPGSQIYRSRFPERNRLISGLARGVLVCEAPSGSGALITADFALDQGRDVFVSASRIGGPRSAGLDRLAEDGAKPAASVRDIFSDWGIPIPEGRSPRIPAMAALDEGPERRRTAAGDSSLEACFLADALRAELRGKSRSRA